MRIVVIGTSGSGKTTLARRLAEALHLPVIELDRINWLPGWRGLSADDPAEFVRRVDAATVGERWICDGNYSSALRGTIWARATHIVWLDYPRHVVMRRVVGRSVRRAIDRRELWPGTGNREDWRKWLRASHPIRWAWSTWRRRRIETAARLSDPKYAHLRVVRLRQPREASAILMRLAETNEKPGPRGRVEVESHLPE
jgi:adenylate kinase family enzyme